MTMARGCWPLFAATASSAFDLIWSTRAVAESKEALGPEQCLDEVLAEPKTRINGCTGISSSVAKFRHVASIPIGQKLDITQPAADAVKPGNDRSPTMLLLKSKLEVNVCVR